MKTKLNISPNARKFTQSMGSIPYSNVAALCDIIDNSLDANATEVHLIITQKNKSFNIRVIDKGKRMDIETLGESLKFGSDTYKDETQLGRFGMGLSTAIHHLCRKAIIVSKNNSNVNAAIWDYNYIVENNVNECEIGQADNKELSEFNKYIKFPTGTIVTFDRCSGVKYKDIKAFCKNLHNEISRKFRDKIRNGIKISINKENCSIIDPLFLDRSELEYDFTTTYNRCNIKIKVVSLPKNFKGSIGDKINNLNSESQGFYVMRNGREIATAVDLGIYSKKDTMNRFRAQLDFGADLDDLMGLDFTKNGVYLNEDLKNYLSEVMTPILIELEAKYNSYNSENETFDYSEIEKIIQGCSNALDFNLSKTRNPRIEKSKDEVEDKVEDNLEVSESVEEVEEAKKEKSEKDKPEQAPSKNNNSLKVKIQNAAMDGDIIYNYTKNTGELIITLNTNHIFYKMLIKDKKLSTPSLLGIFAEISAQVKVLDEIELEKDQDMLVNYFNRLNSIKAGTTTILLNSIKK